MSKLPHAVRAYFRTTLHHFHEYAFAVIALLDSPHLILYAMLALGVLLIVSALILFVLEV